MIVGYNAMKREPVASALYNRTLVPGSLGDEKSIIPSSSSPARTSMALILPTPPPDNAAWTSVLASCDGSEVGRVRIASICRSRTISHRPSEHKRPIYLSPCFEIQFSNIRKTTTHRITNTMMIRSMNDSPMIAYLFLCYDFSVIPDCSTSL
jgi:hypothetical protein